ncbi:cyclic nucleotide-binding domain-containing protein [Streptomyces racemochromogenes]|uniref:cyclic nucleotide-binding domain-containing protein n=1 Tax=Streptomyces racemochromogenes TaxID=67353 RepID=UPI0013E02C4B
MEAHHEHRAQHPRTDDSGSPRGPARPLHRVTFPAGTSIFKEHQRAEKFWIIECGTVDLDTHVPGHKNAVIDTLRHGELLGWYWMFRPYTWHLGATASREVTALEFDAATVRELCNEDSAVGRSPARLRTLRTPP